MPNFRWRNGSPFLEMKGRKCKGVNEKIHEGTELPKMRGRAAGAGDPGCLASSHVFLYADLPSNF